VTRVASAALVARVVEVGESDLIATLITESCGKVSASVRGGRRSSRRAGGSLEPFHTIEIDLEDRGGELMVLRESRIVRVRARLAASLGGLESAGLALRWARHLFPPRVPEPDGWGALLDLLDALDVDDAHSRQELARAGLRILAAVGYGLDFERCVSCGRSCPDGKAAAVDPTRGGLVCSSCGSARTFLTAGSRRAARALAEGRTGDVTLGDADSVLALVADAMAFHAGFEGPQVLGYAPRPPR
jgi:DNA repair protein RecO (recombination protein O)